MRVLTASHGGGEQRQDLFVQGGAARGGLCGEDVAGAQILREQIQRQTHHNSTGKRGGGAGLVPVIARCRWQVEGSPVFPDPGLPGEWSCCETLAVLLL